MAAVVESGITATAVLCPRRLGREPHNELMAYLVLLQGADGGLQILEDPVLLTQSAQLHLQGETELR